MSSPPVFESKATYYNNSTKRWISGTFTLTQSYIQFKENDDDDQQSFQLHLHAISGAERRQSSFVYPSIVVSVGSEKHWFASFPNRDTVYNLIELFWRESLLSKPQRKPSEPKKPSSGLGKKLLGILYESESTLVNAANALSDQGRQLEESQMVLEDTNSDLDVAERFLKSMSLGNVLLMNKQKSETVAQTEDTTEEEPKLKRYKITFTFSKGSSECCSWDVGTLIFKDNIVLLDEHQNEIFSIEVKDLDKLQISSPWEFCLTFSSGLSSKTCHIMCPQLSRLLKFLNSVPAIKRKVVFEDDSLFTESASCSSTVHTNRNADSPLEDVPGITSDSPSNQEMQTQEESEVLSDEDLEEISNVLSNMQALGSAVSREQHDQMERINTLLADVEKTELRIKADNKEIKKNT